MALKIPTHKLRQGGSRFITNDEVKITPKVGTENVLYIDVIKKGIAESLKKDLWFHIASPFSALSQVPTT